MEAPKEVESLALSIKIGNFQIWIFGGSAPSPGAPNDALGPSKNPRVNSTIFFIESRQKPASLEP